MLCLVRVLQHVGKSMSSSKFVSNLEGMNEGENFNKDLLKVNSDDTKAVSDRLLYCIDAMVLTFPSSFIL